MGGVGLAELDDRPPAVVRILAALEQVVVLEVAHELARRRQRQAEPAREVAHRARPLRRDVGEDRDVAAAQAGFAVDQRQQLRRRPPAAMQAAQHRPHQAAELRQLVVTVAVCHITVIVR